MAAIATRSQSNRLQLMPDSLQDNAQPLDQFARGRDWQQFHSPQNLAAVLVVESGELLVHFQG